MTDEQAELAFESIVRAGERIKELEAVSTATEELLVATYRALHRGHWEDGETEAELCSRILDCLCNHFDWPNQEGEG